MYTTQHKGMWKKEKERTKRMEEPSSVGVTLAYYYIQNGYLGSIKIDFILHTLA